MVKIQAFQYGSHKLRQLDFGSDELAVVDVSDEVVTANWTTDITSLEFVQYFRRDIEFENAEAFLCTEDGTFDLDVEALSRLASGEIDPQPELWNLVRLDLSATRSVAWEKMPRGFSVVGFGDAFEGAQNIFHLDEVREFMADTATDAVDVDLVIEALVHGSAGYRAGLIASAKVHGSTVHDAAPAAANVVDKGREASAGW